MRLLLIALVVVLAACPRHAPPTPTTGAIAGVVHDQLTGEPVSTTVTVHDQGSFAVATARAGADGRYLLEDLAPGVYDVVVVLPGTTLQLTGVPVSAGHTTGFDIPVDVGAVEQPPVSFATIEGSAVRVYRPEGAAPGVARVEGTITDASTRERVAGAVVHATSPALPQPEVAVSDDAGRFEFASLPPGVYTLSAYYQVPRRGQIEVRRSDLAVEGGTLVRVPLEIEVSSGGG